MHEDMPDMLAMRRARNAAMLLYFVRQVLHAHQFLPPLAAVFAAIQMDRLDADIDHVGVGRIHRYGAHVALEHSAPGLASIDGLIKTILSDAKVNDVRL